MRISGWRIDAFGALADTAHTGIGEGLTVVYGPNEAGKSTLRHFVLGVLFGFPAGNTRYPRYDPADGAVRSGRLDIVADGEELVLSRVEKKGARAGELTLLGPDGKARGDAELTALLGGLTRGVYDKIFAIGLDELNDLVALTDGDLQDHLLSAGVTGAGRIATRARNQLREQAGLIHRSRAQSTEVAAIREQLRAVEARLAEARRAARDLHTRRDELARQRREAEELAESERAATRAAQRADRLVELWPAYLQAADAEDRLAAMGPDPGPLPADTADRLARALTAWETAEAEVVARRERRERTRAELAVLEAAHQPELVALQPDLAALGQRLSGWASQEEEARTRRGELDELERRLSTELDAVGVADTTELARIGRVVAARDQLEATREVFREKSAARRAASDEVDRQNRELIEAEAALATATAAMEVVPEDLSAQALRIESDRAARETMLLERLTDDASELDRLRHDLAVTDHRAPATGNPARASGFTVEPRAVLLGLAALLGMAAVVAFVVVGLVAGVLFGVAAVVSAAASLLIPGAAGADVHGDRERELRTKIDFLEQKCADSAQLLGFPGVPTTDEIAVARVERNRRSAALTALVAADNRLSTARAAMRAKKEHLVESTRVEERTLLAWKQWLGEHGLPEALRPDGVDDWLNHLDQARALDDQVQAARRRLAELQDSLDEAPRSVRAVTERVQRATRTGDPDHDPTGTVAGPVRADSGVGELQAIVSAIASRVAEAVDTGHEVDRMRDSAEVLDGELDRAVAARDAAAAELAGIYASAGVDDEARLRERLADDEDRRELRAVVEAFRRRLTTGSGAHAEQDRAALAERTPQEWADQRDAASEQARALADRRDEMLRHIGATEREVRMIEVSADLPALALEREELVERLARAVRSWTVLHMAASLIETTLERYLEERQPAVLQRAGAHLATITDGRYTTIRLDPAVDGSPRMSVVDARSRVHSPGELSRGTVEQVYLCLRLALAEGHHQAVPLLLDDVLVDFDPDRAEATVGVLSEVAAGRQVLVFTCHPWVVEIMSEVAPGLGRVDLRVGSREQTGGL